MRFQDLFSVENLFTQKQGIRVRGLAKNRWTGIKVSFAHTGTRLTVLKLMDSYQER